MKVRWLGGPYDGRVGRVVSDSPPAILRAPEGEYLLQVVDGEALYVLQPTNGPR